MWKKVWLKILQFRWYKCLKATVFLRTTQVEVRLFFADIFSTSRSIFNLYPLLEQPSMQLINISVQNWHDLLFNISKEI